MRTSRAAHGLITPWEYTLDHETPKLHPGPQRTPQSYTWTTEHLSYTLDCRGHS